METPVNQMIPAPRADNLFLRARSLARDIERAFYTSSTWYFEKLIGHGSFGAALLFREFDHVRGNMRRRLVLKLPLVPDAGAEDFAREAETLEVWRATFCSVVMLYILTKSN